MGIESLIVILLVGLVAGWLAGQFVRGGGFGLVGDLIVGVVGAFLGGWLLPLIGLNLTGILGAIVTATIGAVILLIILRVVKRA
jgi:uncharacterized membrane protein YeaQ/YmgE (transglycosylase-associated protein family)